MYSSVNAEPSFSEKSFADYHLYTLEGKATLKDNQQKQINFIQVDNAPYKKYYTFDRYSEEGKIMIEFENKKENNLGIPLPKGKVKRYKEKWLEYVEYQYEIKNHKELERAEVHIEHYIYDRNWTMETCSHEYKEKDSQTLAFTTIIRPEDKLTITFKYAIDNRVSVKLER